MLYIVSTPIGNLDDMTYRAVEVLRSVDIVLAEDTRRTGVLLSRFGIEAKMVSAHEHNEAARARLVVEVLQEGRSIAVVTDAGTPLLSDPGARLVAAAVDAGFPVVPVPGASALLAALVASGISADRFTFYGFIPRKGGDRTALLKEIAGSRYTGVIYESPNRTAQLIEDLLTHAGPTRRVAVARELTKLHEEIYRASLAEAVEHFRDREVRGEIVVVVEASPEPTGTPDATADAARALADALLQTGMAPSAVARELRERLGMPRNEAYRLVQER